ncbi:hypothetical protein [Salinarimonas soli]|uniref:Uncharacterized protein n=1 Tax=Salinarimonas soli TaxID=1638099 RepID=A0A5B2V8X2_9HYPH|nr:hypothetical protein [Salinarimonas soli]KAA2235943.1 hypothetical protein F0L46_17415 [Salinarimonas soli]
MRPPLRDHPEIKRLHPALGLRWLVITASIIGVGLLAEALWVWLASHRARSGIVSPARLQHDTASSYVAGVEVSTWLEEGRHERKVLAGRPVKSRPA